MKVIHNKITKQISSHNVYHYQSYWQLIESNIISTARALFPKNYAGRFSATRLDIKGYYSMKFINIITLDHYLLIKDCFSFMRSIVSLYFLDYLPTCIYLSLFMN